MNKPGSRRTAKEDKIPKLHKTYDIIKIIIVLITIIYLINPDNNNIIKREVFFGNILTSPPVFLRAKMIGQEYTCHLVN